MNHESNKGIMLKPIGVIHSPWKELSGSPTSTCSALGVQGIVEVFPDYCEALRDLDGFDRVILIYQFHRCEGWSALVIPYLDTESRGLFASPGTKTPKSYWVISYQTGVG